MKKLSLLFIMLFALAYFAKAQNPVTVYFAKSSNPSQGGEDIDKCLDGNTESLYHSRYSLSTAMPDTVDFNFYNVKSINQIKYTPRPSGLNGVWKNVEVYHSTVDAPNTFVKDFTFTWNDDNNVKTINYPGVGIVKPFLIRFIVKSANSNFSSCAEMNFFSSESGPLYASNTCDMSSYSLSDYKDLKINPSAVNVNTYNSTNESIGKSIDNNFSTIYHSQYNFKVSSSKPAILTYDFTGNPSIDYITYYPRTDNNANGRFGTIEVLYKLAGQSSYTSIISTDLGFSSQPNNISFPNTLNNVTSIQIKVKTGEGGYASCAEMMFFKKTIFDINQLSGNVFNDDLFTTLKPGTTPTQIDAITAPLFKAMANCMNNNTYDNRYRVQYFEPYKVVANLANLLKTSAYSSMENPTGIFFTAGTDAILFVGPEADNFNISLKIADYSTVKGEEKTMKPSKSSAYKLKSGLNIINIAHDGLAYIDYYTDNVAATPIKIHIANGQVNGYFDLAKDDDQRWMSLINNPSVTYSNLDLKGKNIGLLLDKGLLRQYNLFSVKPLVNAYDSLVAIQWHIMGIYKHNIKFNNHMFLFAQFGGGYYAGVLGAHLDYTWGESDVVSANRVSNGPWGIVHELGHVNQLRPAFRWLGMTEVTNNIFSTYTEYTLDKSHYRRLEDENIDPYEGISDIPQNQHISVVGGRMKGYFDLAFLQNRNFAAQNVFIKAAVLWQLQLYYQFAGALKGAPTLQQRISGEVGAPQSGPDYAYWLADMMQVMRGRNVTGVSQEQLALNFVKDASDATGEDLTDFFLKVGFLKPVDLKVDDYGTSQFTMTQAMIDQTISEVKAKGYPKPLSPVLHYLSANSVDAFKNKLLVEGTYGQGLTVGTDNIIVNHSAWKNVVVYENYDLAGSLVGLAMPSMRDISHQTTYIEFPAEVDKVYAVSYDGSKKLVYSRSALPVTLTSFEAKASAQGVQLKWTTASETNNKGFEIWKSTDGVHFTKMAKVVGSGTKTTASQYNLLDKNFTTSSYYKLVQVDNDGRTMVYEDKVRFVKTLDQNNGTSIYPNPVKNTLYINGLTGLVKVKVTDMLGKIVLNKSLTSNGTLTIDCLSLANGVYFVQASGLSGLINKKIIKE